MNKTMTIAESLTLTCSSVVKVTINIYFVSAGNWYYMLDMCCTIELHPSPTFLMFEQWFHIFSNLYISIL